MKFEKIHRKTTFEQAIEAIRNYIVANKLQEGNSLPPEMELANALGVSRNILREALRHYRTLGIIGSKPKIGTFIANLAPENPYRGYLPFIAVDKDSMRELAEARVMLECGAAPLIAARATPERVRELESINARLEKAEKLEERIKLEIELHGAMLRIADNTIINGLIPLLVNFFQQHVQSASCRPARPGNEIGAEHRRLIDAIARRDGDALSGLLRIHSENYVLRDGR